MGAMKALAADVQEGLLSAFLADYPGVDADTVRCRWPRAVELWAGGAVGPRDRTTGVRRVRSSEPQKKRPDETTAYWTRFTQSPAGWHCDCPDFGWRGGSTRPCKHLLSVFIADRRGSAPSPWGTAFTSSPEERAAFERWLDTCRCEHEHEQREGGAA